MSREPEALAVAARYARRTDSGRYSMLRPEVWQTVHERQRAMLGLFTQAGLQDLSRLRLLEVGCGAGGNLLELLRLGFAPQHLGGIELLSERLALARAVLPDALRLQGGDALQADVAAGSLDIVYLATVLSSLLDDAYQQRLGHLRAGLHARIRPVPDLQHRIRAQPARRRAGAGSGGDRQRRRGRPGA